MALRAVAALLLPCALAQAAPAPVAMPWQEELARIVCEFASQKDIEHKSTEKVCSLVHAKLPSLPMDLCEEALDGAWDSVYSRCGLGAPETPSPGDIEKAICEVIEQQAFEDLGVEKACAWVEQHFPQIQFQPDCKTVMTQVWEEAKALCPAERAALPSPADIERMACELASQKQIENRSTEEVCRVIIAQKLPGLPENICQNLLEKAWDAIVKHCHNGTFALAKMPTPEDIERMACEVATQKQIEDTSTAEVCHLIMVKFGVPASVCQPLLEKAWDAIAARCPKGAVQLTPEEIERMACAVASRKIIERRSTKEACKLISEHFPEVPPALCEGLLDKAWDAVVKHCPNATATAMAAAPPPVPKEVEELLCRIAADHDFEDFSAKEACKVIESKFPKMHWQRRCEEALESAWEALLSRCPARKAPQDPSPGDIKELVCDVAHNPSLESLATETLCQVLKEQVPIIKFEPDCGTVMTGVWDSLAAALCGNTTAAQAPVIVI